MEQWINGLLNSSSLTFAALPGAFLLGMLGSVTSCCTAPVLSAIAAYSGAIGAQPDRRLPFISGLFFMVGTIIAFGLLGAVTGYMGQIAGASLGLYWKLGAGLLLVFFGLATLNFVPASLPKFDFSVVALPRGTSGAVLYGLAMGGATTACNTCCNPVLPVALGVSTVQGNLFWGTALLMAFATGFGLPMAGGLIGLGLGIGRLNLLVRRIAPVVTTVAGIMLIGAGFYLLSPL